MDLDENSQKFLKDLFEGVIDNDEEILCWKNRLQQKIDLFIKYKNRIKGISLKCGNSNSMHGEAIENFRQYLEKLGITYKTIEYYISYHYYNSISYRIFNKIVSIFNI
jgi:alcohol dehydrogenase YqhD (iron-dependent ADH family)